MKMGSITILTVILIFFVYDSYQEKYAKKFKLHSGDLIPMIGLGTGGIRGSEEVKEVLDKAFAAGYRLIDTAKIYGNEEDIGKALKELLPKHNLTRKDIFITTKLSSSDLGNNAYEHLTESIRKLDSQYVDLYLLHSPKHKLLKSNDTENAKYRDLSWQQLVKGVKDNLARNIGVSNYNTRHLKALIANDHGIKPAVNQVEFHPYYHDTELLDLCEKEGVLLQAYFSLGGSRSKADLLENSDVLNISKKLDKSPAQVLLRWALQQNVAVIPKSRSKGHLESNLELTFDIPEEDMTLLNSFTKRFYAENRDEVAK